MKSYISLTVSLLFVLVSDSCDQRSDLGPNCNEIHLNKAFTARIGEEWCIPETGWKISFGPMIGDSRCNVPKKNVTTNDIVSSLLKSGTKIIKL